MRSDLKAVAGVSNVKTDLDEMTCCFDLAGDVDVKEMLNKLAKANNKIKDWSYLEN